MNRTIRFLLILLVVGLLASGCVSRPGETAGEPPETCTVTVRVDPDCDKLADRIPGGLILERRTVPFHPGDSILDVLKTAVGDANIRIIGNAYVAGIGNDSMEDLLYEKEAGPQSGWLYYVDGDYVNTGASRRDVMPGDDIVWAYSCSMGEVSP